MNTLKAISFMGIGYMLKSLLVTFGATSENLSVNICLLVGLIFMAVLINIVEKD